MPRICLSYRRSDSAAVAGRIYDRLVARYGVEAVFMDLTDIPYGADFRERIMKAWQGAEVLIAVIGPQWLGRQGNGAARIHGKLDPIRIEIETALRQRILVIPLLVDGAKMPSAGDLPRNIREVVYRHAMPVDSSLDFAPHMQRLMMALDQALGIETTAKPAEMPDDDRKPQPQLPKIRTMGPPIVLSAAMAVGLRLLPYFLVPVILLLLAHYVIVITMDRDIIYLRSFALIIPLVCGFLLLRSLRLGVFVATLLGLSISLVAVAGMMTVVGLVDQHSILPTTEAGWQEAGEFVVTITLATAAGNLLARLMHSTLPGRWRLF